MAGRAQSGDREAASRPHLAGRQYTWRCGANLTSAMRSTQASVLQVRPTCAVELMHKLAERRGGLPLPIWGEGGGEGVTKPVREIRTPHPTPHPTPLPNRTRV